MDEYSNFLIEHQESKTGDFLTKNDVKYTIDEKTIMTAIDLLHTRAYPPNIYLDIIHLYTIYYDQLADAMFLDIAYKHVYAYLKKGYNYAGHEVIFNKILQNKRGINLDKFLKITDCKYEIISCTAYSIHCALGTWHAKKEKSLTKKYITEQILDNIRANRQGLYAYENIQYGVRKVAYVTIEENGWTYIISTEGRATQIRPEKETVK